LNLSEEQCKIIERWADAITAKNAAYSMVVFRMGAMLFFTVDSVGWLEIAVVIFL